jgi:hypothetical protein
MVQFLFPSPEIAFPVDVTRRGPRPMPLCISAIIHGAVIAWALLGTPPLASLTEEKASYPEITPAEEKKIVWYHLHELPLIDPAQQIGQSSEPRGQEKRNDVIIRTLPERKPGDQLVLRPDVKVPLEQAAPAPNLVSVAATVEIKLPAKTFPPPPPPASLQIRHPDLSTPPQIETAPIQTNGDPLREAMGAMPRVTKKFVPPVAPPKVEGRVTLAEIPAPPLDEKRAGVPESGLTKLLQEQRQPRKPFVTPPPQPQSGKGQTLISVPEMDATLGGTINAAILNANPSLEAISALPQGIRSIEMSQAPLTGEAAFRGAPTMSGSGLIVQPQRQAGATSPPYRIEYEETQVAAIRSTFSAPLRPSSRTIPQNIESRFRGRVVYSMIIPMPKLPIYAGDWIAWFAERDPKPGSLPQMRAPLPVRKLMPVTQKPVHVAGRIQLAATILKTGHVDSVEWYSNGSPPLNSAAIADLQSWQFLPALREGEAVDVEIIIEIPFR